MNYSGALKPGQEWKNGEYEQKKIFTQFNINTFDINCDEIK